MDSKEKEVKEGMMELWKKVFHDSKEYINLIFNNYYEGSLKVFEIENNKIVSSILGIPYDFKYGNIILKGLYLCGVATDPEHRRKGLMTKLLNEIKEKAQNDFDFLFLIPSNTLNSIIYSNEGFYNGIYKVFQYYTHNHDFNAEFESSLFNLDEKVRMLKKNSFDNIQCSILEKEDDLIKEEIIKFLVGCEKEDSLCLDLIHTEKDFFNAIEDNFICHGNIFYSFNNDNVTGVIFTTPATDGRIRIYGEYCKDTGSYYKLLDSIKKKFEEMPLSLVRNPEEVNSRLLWSEISTLPNPDGASLESLIGSELRVYDPSYHSSPYAMLKLLKFEKVMEVVSRLRKDINFEVIVIDRQEGKMPLHIKVGKGECHIKEIDSDYKKFKNERKNLSVLTERDFMHILLRKKGKDDTIMEAFGIPRLPINISLMLD